METLRVSSKRVNPIDFNNLEQRNMFYWLTR